MKTKITKTLFLFFLTCTINSFGQYSNATLNGPWLSYAENHIYYMFDGNGNIEEMGTFGGVTGYNIGTYSVNTSGSITGNIAVYSINFTGQFVNSDSATLNVIGLGTFPLYRVISPGALTDTLTGTFVDDTNSVVKNVQFKINSSGQITWATGMTGVNGKIYTENGVFAGYLSTTDNTLGSCWHKMVISGTYTGNTLAGDINFDCNSIGGPINLVRSGNATLMNVFNEFEKNDFSFYPNPFKDALYLNNYLNKDIAVTIFDLFGKAVLKETIHKSNNSINGVELLGSGIYFLQVTQDNNTHIYKILKK